MIYKAILLFVQKFLWSKIKGGIRSKLLLIVMVLGVALLSGALFASFFLDMTFEQGIRFAWAYFVNGFSWGDQLVSKLWNA